jgi:hypothetical protein
MPIMIFMTSYYPDLKRYSRISANPFLKNNIFALLLFPVLLLVTSCNENATTIGINLLPGVDFTDLKSTDTIIARAYNITTDSVVSSKQTYLYMGGLYDPYFGNTYSDFVSQLRITQKWPGGTPTVDSVKLYLSVTGAKGDRTYNMAIKLYEITEELSTDSVYYSKRNPRAGLFIGSFDLGVVAKDTSNSFQIVLPTSFGDYLLRDTTKLFQEVSSNSDFKTFFKGLYVSIGEGGLPVRKGAYPDIPTLLVFDPVKDNFLIRVYYHTPISESAVYYDFVVNDKCAHYNRYFHDLSTADPTKRINHINDSIMDTITCVQAFYGVAGKIRFQGLEDYKKMMPLSINKARLIYNVFLDGTEYTSTTVPSEIYLAYTIADGTRSIVPDYYINASFYGGAYSVTSSVYSFNLAAFVQEYLDGKIPKPEVQMYLPEGEYKNAILKSVGSTKPSTFTLVYTRF